MPVNRLSHRMRHEIKIATTTKKRSLASCDVSTLSPFVENNMSDRLWQHHHSIQITISASTARIPATTEKREERPALMRQAKSKTYIPNTTHTLYIENSRHRETNGNEYK